MADIDKRRILRRPATEPSLKQNLETLIKAGKFNEAYESLPDDVKARAVTQISADTRADIMRNQGDDEVIKARMLSQLERNNTVALAGILHVVREIRSELGQAKISADFSEAPTEIDIKRPGSIIEVMGTKRTIPETHKTPNLKRDPLTRDRSFGEACETLADETFSDNGNSKLKEWLGLLEGQIGSKYGFVYFATRAIRHLYQEKNYKEGKDFLRKKDAGKPLNSEDKRIARIFNAQVMEEVKYQEEKMKLRGFGHLLEYIVLEIIKLRLRELGIRQILKASKEEDFYCGADVFIEDAETGAWFACDIKARNRLQEPPNKDSICPNFGYYISAKDETKYRPNGQFNLEIPPALIKAVGERYLTGLKSGQIRMGTRLESLKKIVDDVEEEFGQKLLPDLRIKMRENMAPI